MPSDIVLEDNDVTLDANDARVHLKAADVLLSAAPRLRKGRRKVRRALVHGHEDSLVLNYGGDYPSGVAVHGTLWVGKGAPPAAGTVAASDLPSPKKLFKNPDAIFDELDHSTPLSVEIELNVLRAAVSRLLERVEALEQKK